MNRLATTVALRCSRIRPRCGQPRYSPMTGRTGMGTTSGRSRRTIASGRRMQGIRLHRSLCDGLVMVLYI